jgi:hypothetical protein
MTQNPAATNSPLPAPPPPQAPTPEDRSTTFQPVEGGTEQHNGATLLIDAYAVLWVILMAWLFFQWRRQAALGTRIDDLERAIDRAVAKSEKSEGK